MIPNIIIEGPDGAGKTTAARSLVEWLGMSYRHDGPPPSLVDDSNCLLYYGILYESFPKPFVWDRSIFGELVYGPIFRNGSRLTKGQVESFISEFCSDGGITVLLLPPLEVITENWKKNHDEQIAKSLNGDSEESREVKRQLLSKLHNIERVHRGYYDISPMFDVHFSAYPTTADWIKVLSDWLGRKHYGILGQGAKVY